MSGPEPVTRFGLAGAALLALVTSTGSASGAPEASERQRVRSASGPELSLSVRWGDPRGQREAGADVAEVVVGQVPVEASAGFRTKFGLSLFAQARYAWLIGRDCADSCSGSVVRVGLGLEYHFTPDDRVDHYVGVGAGYEWLARKIGIAEERYRGPEWVSLSFGEEFALGPIGIGPVLSVALGQYTDKEIDVPPVPPIAEPIDDRAVHIWLLLGLRASYGWR
jgi:hypothetical protein